MTKARAANALTGGALAHPAEQPQQRATEFEMEVAALDVGLHFVEVEGPDDDADKVRMSQWHAVAEVLVRLSDHHHRWCHTDMRLLDEHELMCAG